MNTWLKLLISVVIGWIIAAVLLFVAGWLSESWQSILLWHWGPIYSLAGNGPILGHRPDGTPMYEGTPVHMLFGLIGLFAGFLIYPTVILIIWWAARKLITRSSNKQ